MVIRLERTPSARPKGKQALLKTVWEVAKSIALSKIEISFRW